MEKDLENFKKFLRAFGDLIESTYSDSRKIDYSTYNEQNSTNYDICKSCGGICCKQCGCHFSPRDFKELSFDYLKSEILKGYISIDVVYGDAYLLEGFPYILRVRNVGAPIVEASIRYRKSSQCILLGNSGCKLDYAHRPTGGKLLIPSDKIEHNNYFFADERHCTSLYDIRECCLEWMQYSKLLSDLHKYFQVYDENYPCRI